MSLSYRGILFWLIWMRISFFSYQNGRPHWSAIIQSWTAENLFICIVLTFRFWALTGFGINCGCLFCWFLIQKNRRAGAAVCLFSEQVAMCAGTGQRQHQNIIFYAVDKQPVRKNMTFTIPCPIARQVGHDLDFYLAKVRLLPAMLRPAPIAEFSSHAL